MTWLSQFFGAVAKPFKWWVTVAPWERGVLVRLGKTARELLPGPHWRIPLLDRVYVQSVRTRTITDTNLTATTADRKTVVLSFAVHFAIGDVIQLYNAVANPEHTLRSRVCSLAMQHITGQPSETLSLSGIEEAVGAELAALTGWGLTGVEFRVTAFAYVRTYRLLTNDYNVSSGLYDLEKENVGER